MLPGLTLPASLADIPGLSVRISRCLVAWQQYWQPGRGRGQHGDRHRLRRQLGQPHRR